MNRTPEQMAEEYLMGLPTHQVRFADFIPRDIEEAYLAGYKSADERIRDLEEKVQIAEKALQQVWDLGTDGTRGGPVRGAGYKSAVIACEAIARMEMVSMVLVTNEALKGAGT